jgi:nitrite reductase/ring-hydroxylating ferredoxin subunit/uncharacterized membrane protein
MAAAETLMKAIDEQDWLDQAGEAIAPAITNAFRAGGEAGREIEDFLHGTWLGHPLHPVLTDLPIGAWSTAVVFDAIETISGRKELRAGADAAVAIGLIGALGAAVTGAADWSQTSGRARKIGLLHGLLNLGGAALFGASLVMRRREKSRAAGVGLSMLGYAVANVSAYLGGHLISGEQIGVNHAAAEEYPKDFVPVLAENELPENKPTRVEAGGIAVMLVRKGAEIYAIAETCSHLGGPLAEGKLEGDTIECPWHGSCFSIKNGSVIHGPATFPQPRFETRINNGQIEVRSIDH